MVQKATYELHRSISVVCCVYCRQVRTVLLRYVTIHVARISHTCAFAESTILLGLGIGDEGLGASLKDSILSEVLLDSKE